MTSKVIVVLGVTGNQGGSVAELFLHEPGWTVRGITRDPSKPTAKALAAKGIEVVRGDMDDVESLKAAFRGAYAIFAVTDFWAGFRNPANGAIAASSGILINEYAQILEVNQGKKIADAAAATDGLQRFVYSALSDTRKWSGGKYQWIYHFDSKAKVVDYVRTNLPDLAAKMSTVQICFYATNWKLLPVFGPQKQADGTYLLTEPASPSTPIPIVDTCADTGVFVKGLLSLPPGKNMLGYGSLISKEEYMRLWCKHLGVKGAFKQVSVEEWDEQFPESMRKEVAEASAYAEEFGYDGGDPDVVHPKDLGVDMKTTSIEEYIKKEDWSSITG